MKIIPVRGLAGPLVASGAGPAKRGRRAGLAERGRRAGLAERGYGQDFAACAVMSG